MCAVIIVSVAVIASRIECVEISAKPVHRA